MISSVTNQGKVRFMLFKDGMIAQLLIKFMKRLINDAGRKVFLILDNLRVHHAKKVKEWLHGRTDEIEVFYLPAYSPELNPDEYLNCDLKTGVHGKPPARNQKALARRGYRSYAQITEVTDSRGKLFQTSKNSLCCCIGTVFNCRINS